MNSKKTQERFGTGSRALAFYQNQMLSELNALMQEFIAGQEMVFIATADAQGNADCSFRSGAPGFVYILNSQTVAYPEYRGNGVLASVGNILENPHIGMMFIDFFKSTIGLHVNGKAQVIDNERLADVLQVSPKMILKKPSFTVPSMFHFLKKLKNNCIGELMTSV